MYTKDKWEIRQDDNVIDIIGKDGLYICALADRDIEIDKANAERICLCVNTYDKLLEALQNIARGQLQMPSAEFFTKYAVNIAKDAIEGLVEEC